MSLQYISDSSGKTTGVFIPISEWNELKSRYEDLGEIEVPAWQKEEVRKRIDNFKTNPEQALDFNQTMDDIDNNL